jgi:hypothetical protein
MPDLSFTVEAMEPVLDAAAPRLLARVRIVNACSGELVQSINLRSHVQVEAARRRYTSEETAALADLFGSPERWAMTLKPLWWANTQVTAAAFLGSTLVDVSIPFSFELNLGVPKYMSAVQQGDVPLAFLFSGTVFYVGPNNRVQIAQIPWDREAAFRLPVSACKQLLASSGAGSSWTALHTAVADRIERLRTVNASAIRENAGTEQ